MTNFLQGNWKWMTAVAVLVLTGCCCCGILGPSVVFGPDWLRTMQGTTLPVSDGPAYVPPATEPTSPAPGDGHSTNPGALSCVVPTLSGQLGGTFDSDVKGQKVTGPAIVHNNEGDGPVVATANGFNYVPRVGVIVPAGKELTWPQTVASASSLPSDSVVSQWSAHWLANCP